MKNPFFMAENLQDVIDILYYKWIDLKWRIQSWKFWEFDGWPFHRRCPLCAGDGVRNTETGARYGDEPFICEMCDGEGFIKR